MVEIRPQPGPQETFLASPADLAVYGGAAGGGKTWALLLEPLRHVHVPGFSTVIFRRTCPEITAPGGMWPESLNLYPYLGAVPNLGALSWRFPSGAVVKFAHMQHEADRNNWLGSQVALIEFDQLEQFTEDQFWYMLSRNRSTCGVRPYLRASANPQPGWLADLLSWWIDQDSGFPIPERAGKLRWFVRHDNLIEWADDPAELAAKWPHLPPKSLTFVPAKLQDNRALLRADPGYLANLLALPHVEQQRLLAGNWKVSGEAGEWPPEYFPASIWYEQPPARYVVSALALDPSKGKESEFGDYSAYVFVGVDDQGVLWVDADLERRPTPRMVEDGMALFLRWHPSALCLETNAYQELLAPEFQRAAGVRKLTLPLYGINNFERKDVRIRRVGPFLAQRRLRFRGGSPGCRLLVQQLRDFPAKESHDDGPDALEQAIRMCDYLLGVRGQANSPEVLRP